MARQPKYAHKPSHRFPTTHWSLVLEAGGENTPESRAALEALCEAYWYPLYAFVRRSGHDEDDARDLIQGFFARFLERDYLRERSPEKGRFRSYLLAALKHFMAKQRDRARAKKRGGRQQALPLVLNFEEGERRYVNEPRTDVTAESIYEQRWALAMLGKMLDNLRMRYEHAERLEVYEALEGFLPGGRHPISYKGAANRLGVSVDRVKGLVYRLRGHYRDMLRAEVAQTVSGPDEVDDEIRYLAKVVGGRS